MADTRFQSPHGEYEPLYDSLKRRVGELVDQIESLAARLALLEQRDAEREKLLGSMGLRGEIQEEPGIAKLSITSTGSTDDLLPTADEVD